MLALRGRAAKAQPPGATRAAPRGAPGGTGAD